MRGQGSDWWWCSEGSECVSGLIAIVVVIHECLKSRWRQLVPGAPLAPKIIPLSRSWDTVEDSQHLSLGASVFRLGLFGGHLILRLDFLDFYYYLSLRCVHFEHLGGYGDASTWGRFDWRKAPGRIHLG
jgi:hypothetical protein